MYDDEEIGWLIAERDQALQERNELIDQLSRLRANDKPVVIDYAKSKSAREALRQELRIEIRKEYEDQLSKCRDALLLAHAEIKRMQKERMK